MTLDDALLWLNDRIGKNVAAWVAVTHWDLDVGVLEAAGELRHWTQGRLATRALSVPRDDIAGLYEIGGASLDLSNVRPLKVSTWPDAPDHLIVQLDEHTTLEIVEQDELQS